MQKNISAAERVKRSGTKSISEGAKEKNWSKLKATNDLLPKEESTTYQLLLRASGTVESVLPVLGTWVEAWPREPKRGGGRKEERERETLGKKIGERGIFEAANFTSCLKAAAAGEIASTDHKLEQALVEPRSSSRRLLSIWPSAGKGDSHYLPRSSRADVIRKPP